MRIDVKTGDKVMLLNGRIIEVYMADDELDLIVDKEGEAYNYFEIQKKVN